MELEITPGRIVAVGVIMAILVLAGTTLVADGSSQADEGDDGSPAASTSTATPGVTDAPGSGETQTPGSVSDTSSQVAPTSTPTESSTATPLPTPTPTPKPAELTDGDPATTTYERQGLENFLRLEINDYREQADLDSLSWQDLYQDPAREHAEEMARYRTLDKSVNGTTVRERFEEISPCNAGILIERVDGVDGLRSTANEIVDRWASQSDTREALRDDFDDEVATGTAQDTEGNVYVVAIIC